MKQKIAEDASQSRGSTLRIAIEDDGENRHVVHVPCVRQFIENDMLQEGWEVVGVSQAQLPGTLQIQIYIRLVLKSVEKGNLIDGIVFRKFKYNPREKRKIRASKMLPQLGKADQDLHVILRVGIAVHGDSHEKFLGNPRHFRVHDPHLHLGYHGVSYLGEKKNT